MDKGSQRNGGIRPLVIARCLVVHSFNSMAQFPFFTVVQYLFFTIVQYLFRSSWEVAGTWQAVQGSCGSLQAIYLGGIRW